jgi:hypothetical protein
MAICQGTSPSRLSQDACFIPQQDGPRSEVAAMFRAALDLAHLQLTVDGSGARCASCQVAAACMEELSHSPDCAADGVLKAREALKSKVSRKQPAVSTTILSPQSAA